MNLKLTDSEWVQLIDGESEDSQLQKCCGNISELRDLFVSILRSGRHEQISSWDLDELKKRIKWVADGHNLTPLLQKVCEQIKFDPTIVEHTKGNVE